VGMEVAHVSASGMGGMRTAGDLVARMQISRRMKIKEAKGYVATRLGVSVQDLADPIVMGELRQDLNIGTVAPFVGGAKGIEAKLRIAELLGIEINCVNRFRDKVK
jgi:dimethylamine--corrinoid protein Co-methyltransferase